MRTPIVALIAIAALMPGWAKAKPDHIYDPGGGEYVDTKHSKVTKDYFVVRDGNSDKCSIVAGQWANKPAGALGTAPYASKGYAKAALKKLPECKGGETDEAVGKKHKKE
jgi:hypothetical protein